MVSNVLGAKRMTCKQTLDADVYQERQPEIARASLLVGKSNSGHWLHLHNSAGLGPLCWAAIHSFRDNECFKFLVFWFLLRNASLDPVYFESQNQYHSSSPDVTTSSKITL